MVRKRPEVMVKITGFGKHKTGIKGHLSYISRNGELAVESSDGRLLKGMKELEALATKWSIGSSRTRMNQRDTVNLVLSMPAGTNRDAVLKAAAQFADKTFRGKHDYVYVDHRDEKHAHVHLTVCMRGHDRRRLNPRKADLQQWREGFAEALRAQGVEASATPRRARGVMLKPIKQEIFHMRERADVAKAQGVIPVPIAVDRKAIDEAFVELLNPGAAQAKPWEDPIRSRQRQVRGSYLKVAKVLDSSSDPDERTLANDIRAFVSEMPVLATRRHIIKRSIVDQINKSAEQRRTKYSDEIDR